MRAGRLRNENLVVWSEEVEGSRSYLPRRLLRADSQRTHLCGGVSCALSAMAQLQARFYTENKK